MLGSSGECSNDCQGMDGKGCKNLVLQKFKFNLTSTPHQFVETFEAGDKGFGLRAKRRIPKGTFLVKYSDEMIHVQVVYFGNNICIARCLFLLQYFKDWWSDQAMHWLQWQ